MTSKWPTKPFIILTQAYLSVNIFHCLPFSPSALQQQLPHWSSRTPYLLSPQGGPDVTSAQNFFFFFFLQTSACILSSSGLYSKIASYDRNFPDDPLQNKIVSLAHLQKFLSLFLSFITQPAQNFALFGMLCICMFTHLRSGSFLQHISSMWEGM